MTAIAATLNPDVILIGGDFAYDNGLQSCYYCFDQTLWNIEQDIFGQNGYIVPMVISIGNHEVGLNSLSEYSMTIDESGPLFVSFFPQHSSTDSNGNLVFETPAVSQRRSYHYHTFGSVLLLSLDTGYLSSYNGEQLEWMQNIVNNASFAGYSRMSMHHEPIYSPSYTSEELSSMNVGNSSASPAMQFWVPFFDNYTFSAAFENHRHVFKVTFPLTGGVVNPNGTLYLGEGQWGVTGKTADFDNSTGYFTTYGYANNVWQVIVDQQNSVISYVPYGDTGSALNGSCTQYFNFNL